MITGDTIVNIAGTLRLEGSAASDVSVNPADFDFVWTEITDSGVLGGSPLPAELTLGLDQRNLVAEPGLLEVGVAYVRSYITLEVHRQLLVVLSYASDTRYRSTESRC